MPTVKEEIKQTQLLCKAAIAQARKTVQQCGDKSWAENLQNGLKDLETAYQHLNEALHLEIKQREGR